MSEKWGLRKTESTDMYFWHMDIKYKDQPWTEGETGKMWSKERAQTEILKKVQDLRDKGVLVKNLKLCRIAVVIEEEEEEEEKIDE
jgi:hypothetical protein